MRNAFCCALHKGEIGKWIACGIIAETLLTACSSTSAGAWGEYGGNLDYLRFCYTPPQSPSESNFYIDMMDGSFRHFAAAHGLTNNHALFVVSHGKALDTPFFGLRYAFYPEKSSARVPCYSAGDLARLVGPAQVPQIHILVIAGCNQENMFFPAELRHYFPSVTNIIHALPNTDANLASFWELLTYNSQQLQAIHPSGGDLAARQLGTASSQRRGFYIAELYQPGERKPYRKQVAGRELLEPDEGPYLSSMSSNR